MVSKYSVILCALVLGNALYQAESVLKITFIEDLCYNSELGELDLKYETSGILMSSPRGEGIDCQLVLTPPRGAHVVLSIYRYDLDSDDVLIIEDSDRHRVALMGYGVFRDEKKTVISEGKMRIRYTTGNRTHALNKRAGFQFTYTKVMKSPCSSNEFKCANGYCILKNYLCDGHNHCGDSSDQKKCDSIRKEPKVDPEISEPRAPHPATVNWAILLTIAVLIVLTIIVVTVIVLALRSKQKKTKTGQVISPGNGSTEAGTSAPHQAPSESGRHNLGQTPLGTGIHHSGPAPSAMGQTPPGTGIHHSGPAPSGMGQAPEPSGTGRQLQSVSGAVSHQQNVHQERHLQSASVHQDGTQDHSFYSRVRRSLRGQPRIENVPKERSSVPEKQSMYPRLENVPMERMAVPERHHQVPSMYPSLDHMPSAPEMVGVDNPEFKIEE